MRVVRRSAARVALLAPADDTVVPPAEQLWAAGPVAGDEPGPSHCAAPGQPRAGLVSPAGLGAGHRLVGPAGKREPATQVAVLLLSGRDPSAPRRRPFWILPGGGLDEGETPEQALRREVYEELGAQVGDPGPPVWRRRAVFVFDGRRWEQNELIYVTRTQMFTPVAKGLTHMERRMVTGARWWPLASLASTSATVYPDKLASLLTNWLAAGPPPAPLPIS